MCRRLQLQRRLIINNRGWILLRVVVRVTDLRQQCRILWIRFQLLEQWCRLRVRSLLQLNFAAAIWPDPALGAEAGATRTRRCLRGDRSAYQPSTTNAQ
jgi:hypothetical protein